MQRHRATTSTPLAVRTVAVIALSVLVPVLTTSARAQAPTYHGTPISMPSDCRTGACAQSPVTAPLPAPAWTGKRAAAAIAGYWAASDHVSYLIFPDGDAVVRLVEVVNGQVTRDRHVTFMEQAPDSIKPGHLVFNLALKTTGVEDAAPESMSIELYNGLHELDLSVTPDKRVRMWFVRKTDQLDVDALEHPRTTPFAQGAASESPEPGQRLGLCPEARAWQASLSYPANALRQGLYSGSVTLGFVARPDGTTSEYRVEAYTDDRLVGATLEALARLKCTGVSNGQPLRQTVDYKAVD